MEMPLNLRDRPLQDFGGKKFMVPWFVAKIGNRFDFRVIRPMGVYKAHTEKRCWLCGKPREKLHTFVIGPMCAVNRVSSEPPSHPECALYAALTCPFLSNPKMRRSPRDLPDGTKEMAGVGLPRNPGVTALWTTKKYNVINIDAVPEIKANAGVLFDIGDPIRVAWFREGRSATKEEILASIDGGLPTLMELAMAQGRGAVMELQQQYRLAMQYLPKELILNQR